MSAPSAAPTTERLRPSAVPAVTVVLLGVLAAVLALQGWSYYALPIEARIEHESYRVLSPSGVVGHGYGIVGTFLMLTNLLYLVRRRFAKLSLGSMRRWLDLHVLTGLGGSMLVAFHSAFQLRTPIASLTAGSLCTVVVTGLVGRYFYALSPTPPREHLEGSLAALGALAPGLDRELRRRLAGVPVPALLGTSSLVASLAAVPRCLGVARARREAVRSTLSELLVPDSLDAHDLAEVRRVARTLEQLVARDVTSAIGAALLRSWRGLHRWMAIVMVLSVAVHIGVAWYYGYRWLLSE